MYNPEINKEKGKEEALELAVSGGASLVASVAGAKIAQEIGVDEETVRTALPYVFAFIAGVFKYVVRRIRNRKKHEEE